MKEKNKKFIALVIVIITSLRCISSFVQFNYNHTNTSGYRSYNIKIINEEKRTEEKIVYLVALEQNNIFADKFILNIYDNKDAVFYRGDVVSIVGKITIPQLLGNPRRI